MRVLPDTEKLEFVRKSVSWIEGRDIMDTCIILNFGYDAPLPWPQVLVISHTTRILTSLMQCVVPLVLTLTLYWLGAFMFISVSPAGVI